MPDMETILKDLPRIRAAAGELRDILLGDTIHIVERPALTGNEEKRVEFFVNRLAESGVVNTSIDEKGNGFGFLPGSEGKRNILLFGYADTYVEDPGDRTVEVESSRVVGPFVGDNSLALSALLLIPLLLEKLGLTPRSNLILMAAAKTLGRGNLEGLRSFLQSSFAPVHAGLCLESVQLGRLNYACLGLHRCEVTVRLPDNYNWVHYGSTGTITPMSEIITKINAIPVPRRPLTAIVLGSIAGGVSPRNIARETKLEFEIRSESPDILREVRAKIAAAVEEVGARSGMHARLDIVSERDPGGIDLTHPLVQNARAIMAALDIQPMMYATTSAMSALIDARIPALTLGITTGERLNELDEIDEALALAPMPAGIAHILGILLAIDGGLCDVG